MKKYRELVELKGLIRERKTNYVILASQLGLSTSAISNKINGKSVFDILEAEKIAKYLKIEKNDIPRYFF